MNGTTATALMLLDVLDEFDWINICYAYKYKGETIEDFPASLKVLEQCEPLYKTVKGWNQDLTRCTKWEDLPEEAKNYIAAVEEVSGVPVKIISVGPGRLQTIIREEIL
jgi:adenylosuccinate synthase